MNLTTWSDDKLESELAACRSVTSSPQNHPHEWVLTNENWALRILVEMVYRGMLAARKEQKEGESR